MFWPINDWRKDEWPINSTDLKVNLCTTTIQSQIIWTMPRVEMHSRYHVSFCVFRSLKVFIDLLWFLLQRSWHRRFKERFRYRLVVCWCFKIHLIFLHLCFNIRNSTSMELNDKRRSFPPSKCAMFETNMPFRLWLCMYFVRLAPPFRTINGIFWNLCTVTMSYD